MSIANQLAQVWIMIPVALILASGFAVAVRSVDVRAGTVQGVRQMASNLSYTVASVALVLSVLLVLQGMAGYNLRSAW